MAEARSCWRPVAVRSRRSAPTIRPRGCASSQQISFPGGGSHRVMQIISLWGPWPRRAGKWPRSPFGLQSGLLLLQALRSSIEVSGSQLKVRISKTLACQAIVQGYELAYVVLSFFSRRAHFADASILRGTVKDFANRRLAARMSLARSGLKVSLDPLCRGRALFLVAKISISPVRLVMFTHG